MLNGKCILAKPTATFVFITSNASQHVITTWALRKAGFPKRTRAFPFSNAFPNFLLVPVDATPLIQYWESQRGVDMAERLGVLR